MRTPGVSRADLLRCLGETHAGVNGVAGSCGFQRVRDEMPVLPVREAGTSLRKEEPRLPSDEGPVLPGIEEPLPRLTFLQPLRTTMLASESPPPPKGNPITDEELAIDLDCRPPAFSPLVRWARLEPYLRSRLGAMVPGSSLDLPQLLRRLARGCMLLDLPRRKRPAWAAQALVLWDDTPEMHGFAADAAFLLKHLRRERGKHGLKVVTLKSLPDESALQGVPLGVPVLALSAMGQLSASTAAGDAWVAMARTLVYRGHGFFALTPCPRSRWHPQVGSAWPTAVWDRHPRLPRQGGLCHHGQAGGGDPVATQQLLDWLSPASRVESALLREVRLVLGHDFNAGTERDAWEHVDCWRSPGAFGFLPGPAYEERLVRRREAAAREPDLAKKIGELIARHHGACSPVIAAEAALRSCLSGSPEAGSLKDLADLLGRVVDRLRDMATRPGSREGRRSGLARWFEDMVARLTPEMRSHPELAEAIARGLALAGHFHQASRIDWPEGVERRAAMAESMAAADRLPAPVNYQLIQQGRCLSVAPQSPIVSGIPLALLRAGRPALHFESAGPLRRSSSFHLPATPQTVPLLTSHEPMPFRIESDRQRLDIDAITRPAWARRMWYDRHGLAAEFAVKGVPFVLRWIPPGRFRMGSPEYEPGRFGAEGLRRERVVEKGFWLGETVVTQVQWRAVMGGNPSRFQGPGTLPVERISWQDCRDYCAKLSALVPDLGFRLPSEAEWEYACRAGTETALWTGGITIKQSYDAPELEDIAWYVGNSWKESVVTNPYDMKSFDWRHPRGDKAGTHAVKGKEANRWGLYDMLGNVWEWCSDPWDEEAYAKLERGEPPLEGEEGSERVVRGGSWIYLARFCRAACRDWVVPDVRRFDLGFRLAAGQEPASSEARRAEEDREPQPGSGATVPERPSRARRAGSKDPA